MVDGEPMADGIAAGEEARARLRAVVISLAVSVVRNLPMDSPKSFHLKI